MNERQTRTRDMLEGLLSILDSTEFNSKPPLLEQMRTRLQASVTRIDGLRHDQMKGETAMTGRALTILKGMVRTKYMRPLAHIARPLIKFSPAEAVVWRLPHPRTDARTVAAQALAMIKALKPHRKLLTSAGLPEGFMSEFEQHSKRLMKGDLHIRQGRHARSRATRELTAEFKKGAGTVQVITGLMMIHAKDGGVSWRNAAKLGKKIGRPRNPRRRSRTSGLPNEARL